MITEKQARDWAEENADEMVFAEGLSESFVGIAFQANKPLAVYDICRTISIFHEEAMQSCNHANHDECDHYTEAQEWYDHNLACAWVGPGTMLLMETCAGVEMEEYLQGIVLS